MLNADDRKPHVSWIEAAKDRFTAANAVNVSRTRGLLRRIISDDVLHARFINTLSMLEHLGSHKIMATQHTATIDQATLRHIAEEAHHAYFMKRQAEKVLGEPMEYLPADLLAGASARIYFQRLEATVLRLLRSEASAGATYLYMSMIIEFRALWFYGLYQEELKRAHKAMSLKRIIGEEENHLGEMAQQLDAAGELSDTRVDAFLAAEAHRYLRMLDAIDDCTGSA